MIALYASQSAGAAPAISKNLITTLPDLEVEIDLLPRFPVGISCNRTTPTIATAKNHPSYRVRQAAARHKPHFVRAFVSPCVHSLKKTTAQMKNARYSVSPIAVDCM